MSWNLLIHNDGEPLGEIAEVTVKLNELFHGLEWTSPIGANLSDHSIRLELEVNDGLVQDIYTHGGFSHIKRLADMCKRENWQIADAQEGENIDLDDPERWYHEHS